MKIAVSNLLFSSLYFRVTQVDEKLGTFGRLRQWGKDVM